MRVDGRPADAMRPVEMTVGFQEYAEGSVLISMGRTRVLCAATVEECVPQWLRGRGEGWVTAEYGMLPRSTTTRTRRVPSGRSTEIQRLIGRSLRASLELRALGERTITVDCDVLQADGGTRTAAITGGYVALALAVDKLVQKRVVHRQVWRAPVAAISVGLVGKEMLLDLCYEEDARAEVDCNVVMNARGHLVDVGATAEGAAFTREQFDQMVELAAGAVKQLIQLQRQALGQGN
ncbi:MAG TPA: ribonuclease PH [Anaerolineae bacterium]|nr:ribonuclease PH [Anaerolineae bacterium]HOQ99731.1 ribonuclease PH [Anaerolineae bacterium]HPL28173.1 ribonuclease PH [Anaerolineae bacterium]